MTLAITVATTASPDAGRGSSLGRTTNRFAKLSAVLVVATSVIPTYLDVVWAASSISAVVDVHTEW